MKLRIIIGLFFLSLLFSACTKQPTFEEINDPYIYTGVPGGSIFLNGTIYYMENQPMQKKIEFVADDMPDKSIFNLELIPQCKDENQPSLEIYINKRQIYSSLVPCGELVETSISTDKLRIGSNDILFIPDSEITLNNIKYYFDNNSNSAEVISLQIEISEISEKNTLYSYPDIAIEENSENSIELQIPNTNIDVVLQGFVSIDKDRKLVVSVNDQIIDSMEGSGLHTIQIPSYVFQTSNRLTISNQKK